MIPATWVWKSLCTIAYWNEGNLKDMFSFGEFVTYDDGSCSWVVSFRSSR